VVDVYGVGLHRLVDQGLMRKKRRGGERGRHVQKREDVFDRSARKRRTTTIVKTSFVEITAALEHVIDYWDAEHRRQVHSTVRKLIQLFKGRLNTV